MDKTVLQEQAELEDKWSTLSDEERIDYFHSLPRADAEELFLELPSDEQATIMLALDAAERRSWMRLLEPDDAADIIQAVPQERQEELLNLLDVATRNEVIALLAYAEDVAGGLMNPRYAKLRGDMSAAEAIRYLQRQSREQAELIAYAYVVDTDQRLLGTVSFRDLCHSQPTQHVNELMTTDFISVSDHMDQEEMSRIFAESDLMALPVVDDDGHMKGIVTIDDIVDVVSEEATEDIQKLGGTEALSAPYLRVRLTEMLTKRAGWLLILFVGEMFTATAMGYFEKEIARAVVLALFVPLIVSAGGNAGSQATTLVIRAMALDEIRLRDFLRVVGRELIIGCILGVILGFVGLLRIILWQSWGMANYGAHAFLIALTIFLSVIGVVAWGTVAGAALPFILRSCKVDPATASTPFVATLVDVTGLVIYFTTASIILRGTLL